MPKLPKFTVDDILSWGPCGEYNLDKLKGYFGRRKYATALMVIEEMRGKIPDEHILWLVLRPECIPEKILHSLACDFAWKVLPIYEKKYPDDKRPRKAIQTKRRWIKGKATDEELEIARAAAWAAAREAARVAWEAARVAWEAAGGAAGGAVWAAREAAGVAVWAAKAAAWEAAGGAARAAETATDAADAAAAAAMRKWQVDEIEAILRGDYGCR